MSSAGEPFAPGGLRSLLEIMKAFNAALLCHATSTLAEYAEQSGQMHQMYAYNARPLTKDQLEKITLSLTAARLIAVFLDLVEIQDAIQRVATDMKATSVSHVSMHYWLQNLIELMKNELDKRKVFALDPAKSKYYQADAFGVKPPPLPNADSNELLQAHPPEPLFSERAIKAFPSAYMDIVEGGRCLALNRNNAAIYHLMQGAEVGLRSLAWDRRVTVTKWKKQVPLEFAQWGDMIGEIQKKNELINHWPRSLREEASRYYKRALFEVDSFNEIFRKHISHARGELYEPDVAISCWGHVYRFMDMLAERMSETNRTPNVWNSPKKAKPSVFD